MAALRHGEAVMLSAIIARLNSIPGLNGLVSLGVPAQMESLGSAPHVWITDVSESGGASPILGPVRQVISFSMEVTCGASTATAMMEARDQVRAALVGFQADEGSDPVVFVGGRIDFTDHGWSLWRDEYRTGYYYQAH